MDERKNLRDLDFSELEALVLGLSEPKYRAKQLYSWLHQNLVTDYGEMHNIGKALRERLSQDYTVSLPEAARVLSSKRDDTKKFVFRLTDGHLIESVYMKYRHGVSACISSQVGCRMGCRFCASTLDGLVRNLTSGEMLSQVYQIQRLTGERVSHVVLMGSGEPLDNYDPLIKFLRMLSDPAGLSISRRNVTVSTCGLVPGIQAFSKEAEGVTLALSLHAPTDKLRRQLLPVAKRYPLEEVFSALRLYFKHTGRRVTLEYTLLSNVNDRDEDAKDLVRLLRSVGALGRGQDSYFACHVNLIPMNAVSERAFRPPEKHRVEAFRQILERSGVPVTVRRQMGADIAGACGQLRRDMGE